ncbi:MAG: transcriptional repressor [Oscillibacter sp.]|nr:transcriptional repressor [Oscillibacter sp.]
MAKYMTRQRKALLPYLRAHPDELLSAQQIADALGEASLSLSAVYRNLSELEAEGKVRRSHRGSDREVFFQYMDADACRNCLHLSCKRCGRTFHMDAEEAKALVDTVAARDGFAIDKAETVLYGVCGDCREGSESRNFMRRKP